MKMRIFKQNKLWRDKAVNIIESMGSKINWIRLDDAAFDKELRIKLLEEAHEVVAAQSRDALIEELADVVEVMKALCDLHKISF
jgi:predicted house-cleaning noncanonical NTP pyrophosphatase (MazG superfamily)